MKMFLIVYLIVIKIYMVKITHKLRWGHLVLKSFARSCNRTFSELGNELIEKDKMVLETYVAALGGAEKVGWRGSVFHTTHFEQMPEEKSVTIWGVKEIRIVKSGSANNNGQKDVRMSPLAIANMMATIARGEKRWK